MPDQVIDAHAHIVPPSLLTGLPAQARSDDEFAARQTDQGWVVSVPGMGETRPIGKRMIDSTARRVWRERTGIDQQVLSPWMDVQSGRQSAPAARDWARKVNDAMCESATELGTVALASLDTTDGEQAASELELTWKRPEIVGVMLSTDPLTGPPLHDPSLEPVWTLAEREQIPVMLHPPTCGPSNDLRTLGRMGNVHGRLVDNTIAVSQLILHGLLDRHPELRIVLVHGGGYLPYQAGRLDGGYRTEEAFAGELDRGRPSAYLESFYYDTVGMTTPSIEFLAGLVGTERVLLGSDYPFALGDPDPVGTVRAADLGPDAVAGVLHDNATALFGLGGAR